MREITFREAIREALIEEMEGDPMVFVLGENVAERGGVYQVTKGILDRFGKERIIEMPISESGFVGAAVGRPLRYPSGR